MTAKSRSEYAPSILQTDLTHCFLCGRCDRKLDRHEVFPGAYRSKCKADGLWVTLCHYPCHEGANGAQYDRKTREFLAAYAQGKAMDKYGWTTEQFIQRYGKNWR